MHALAARFFCSTIRLSYGLEALAGLFYLCRVFYGNQEHSDKALRAYYGAGCRGEL